LLLAATLLSTLGCASQRYDPYGRPDYAPYEHPHATEGAILGGLAGSGVGRALAGYEDEAAGFWIGGALGAITGAVIGDSIDRQEAYGREARYPERAPGPGPDLRAPGRDEAYGPADRYPDVPPPSHARVGRPDHGDDGRGDAGQIDDAWDPPQAYDPSPPPEPLVLNLPDEVLFAKDSVELEPGAKRRLRAVAVALRHHPGTRAVIRGYASRGEAPRPALSEERARAVRDYLVRQGVVASRVTALGMGARFPVASERSAAGRQRNRRAEIEIRTDRGREQAGLW